MSMLQEIEQAEHRIRSYIRTTPLEHSLQLSCLTGGQVWLKLENFQHTGSFKVRGAMNALLSLTSEQRVKGVVTASSGNHGIAVAFGLHSLHMPGIIFTNEGTSPAKVSAIRAYGVPVHFWGTDCVVAEEYAREYAAKHDVIYISPYNDSHVIAGQGTIGVEICQQAGGSVDVVLAALGGGGMISGIASYLKTIFPHAEVIGCSPENSAVMAKSVQAGRILELESLPTLSDGTAGGVEQDAITFPLCQQLIDDYILVTEEEIRRAMRLCMQTHHMLIEGAAGVPLAALLKDVRRFRNKTVVVVLCGANVSLETLRTVIG